MSSFTHLHHIFEEVLSYRLPGPADGPDPRDHDPARGSVRRDTYSRLST